MSGWLRFAGYVPLFFLARGGSAQTPATFFVRPDGGSAAQCTGTADAPYAGRGSGQPCAWSHPFWALKSPTEWKLSGGDRLLIAPGSYRIGVGGPVKAWPFDDSNPAAAHLPPLPSGPSPAQPTVLAGAGYDTNCQNRPELWGSRIDAVLDLSGTSNATVACLEFTDHATCGLGHPELPCRPQDDAAGAGIYAKGDRAAGILLRDLSIHGLASAGILGHFGAITIERVTLAGNSSSGWNTDVKTRGIFNPTVKIDRSTIEWNGCVEQYPKGQPADHGCWGEVSGGYGDGIGTDEQGGSWTITNSVIRYNTQDGLDLLYITRPGAKVLVDGVTAYGNAGNQIKIAGEALVRNNIIVANCSFFDGKPFSILKDYFWEDAEYHKGDHCRANGDALVVTVQNGVHSRVLHNTIVGEGDFLFWGLCRNADDKPCTPSSTIELAYNIFRGFRRKSEFRNKKLGRSGDLVSPIFAEDGVVRTIHHNLYFNVDKAYGDLHAQCPIGPGDICADPKFAGDVLSQAFDGKLLPGSPAREKPLNLGAVQDHP
jgi:hypothetical protein